ncbi:E3 ubiquitin-protein ligase SH3RF3 [Musca vetustissima]|uniref:E3 ubiquitin-protein ligase SH3RF3 n=1 Tax=Musca vetustissima TaxID=27455 RepID=UPI002AB66598|nr:E3 ubiquitin-protein ligase SH3RF3 [Musca vetustissima]
MDENTLNDLLECSVCLDRLKDSKVLPCQHTFCRKCLEVIYASRQELRCPECRILVETKIDDLPPNVLLMRILEGMKNAAAKQQNQQQQHHTTTSSNEDRLTLQRQIQQQQQLQHQQHQQQQHQQFLQLPAPTNIAQNLTAPQHHHPQQQQQLHQPPPQSSNQQRRCIVPHAYALYDFDSSEPNDLKFKKGDLILLRRKIDSNWYVGQFKGVEGNFPINYVQVVVPLPSAQCIALYDFKMGPNEEEGCLTFKKGTVIQVLRRVDQNWAEGRIGSSIGIFPIAFVELNHLAKQLLENFTPPTAAVTTAAAGGHLPPALQQQQTALQQQQQESRDLPPIPVSADSSTSAIDSTKPGTSTNIQLSCSSSSNSSATTSPTSTTTNPSTSSSTTASSTNTIFHSMPNSPQSSMPTTPQHSGHHHNPSSSSVRLRNNDMKHKRHSLNALLNNNGSTALSIMQSSNRHSAEILSVPNDFEPDVAMSSTATGQTTAAREQQHHATNLPPATNKGQTIQNPSNMASTSSTPRHNVLKTCQQNVPPTLPWGYLALYPYKPRKNDELELKKGCVYMVTERCLDGWFKGKNWKDISGVFPGNYVTPLRARDQQQLMHSWKLIPPTNYINNHNVSLASGNHQHTLQQQQQQQQQMATSTYSSSMRHDLENINARLTLANLTPHQAMPPDLPPRHMALSPVPLNNQRQPQEQPQTNISSRESRDKEALKEKPTTTGCMSTSSSSSNSTSSASAGLKKFLTHIKSRSKSPGAAIAAVAVAASTLATTQINAAANAAAAANAMTASTPTQQQQQQQQQGSMTGHGLTPVHVRSGSCPSQLLQHFPNDRRTLNETKDESGNVTAHSLQQQQLTPPPPNGYSSQRIKGPKERASLENTRPTIDSTLRSIYANHIQQQSNLMPKKCAQQYQQQQTMSSPQSSNTTNMNSTPSTTAVIHRKSHSLDASNILQSSSAAAAANNIVTAATSSSDLTQCNINAAAVHASATTNTPNNMTESRFRCVVPYPPNSEVELELQVGDIIFVYRKQKNGWYKGTNSRTYKTGLFPASFVEPDL